MSGKGDADSARIGGNDVSGEGGMTREVIWNPDLMMIRASELGRLVEHLGAGQSDGSSFEGTTVAAPILLSIAAEIGFEGMAM